MQVDLIAGSRYRALPSHLAESMTRHPTILVFDSGLGGLTVFAEILRARPDAQLVYAADDAGFPYGAWSEAALVERVNLVMDRLIARFRPDAVVVACNTASTLVLPHLRARFPAMPFVGTVPAIKPAAAQSRSKMISVLATPGTVVRDYTRALIETYAADCAVTLVGSAVLAGLAEAWMKGEPVADADLLREITPCFVETNDRRTDAIVLACTHYPLLLARFTALSPWAVDWIDPAPAIARRVDHVLADGGFEPRAPFPDRSMARVLFTSATRPAAALAHALRDRGLSDLVEAPIPVFA
ncbi:glutamate racemase [Beijerinckia sp. L45]|uniref:glutamate racemase n=1 Tax=Beijerinckia sp. L45 TaxID=1641855 RepID=UPI00131C0D59|nr:glutamate racemase [Beijerinckia sp. L45]